MKKLILSALLLVSTTATPAIAQQTTITNSDGTVTVTTGPQQQTSTIDGGGATGSIDLGVDYYSLALQPGASISVPRAPHGGGSGHIHGYTPWGAEVVYNERTGGDVILIKAPAHFPAGPLPGMVLSSNEGGSYQYRVGLNTCGTWSHPAEWFGQVHGQEMPGNTERGNVELVVQRAYTCWAAQGLVPGDMVGSMPVRAQQYAASYTFLCGVSLAPLGLPDSRPSKCASAPNLNLP